MLQTRFIATDRKKQLKGLGVFVGLLLILFWASTLWWQDGSSRYVRNLIGESTDFLVLSVIFSMVIVTLIYFLFRGHEWAWWGVATLFVLLPVFIMLVILIPVGGGLAVLCFFRVLYESSPRTTFVPTSLPGDVDDLATALHFQWEEIGRAHV